MLLITAAADAIKTPVDAVVVIGKETTTNFPNEGILFQGPGEYEVKGAKITGFRVGGGVMYTIVADGMAIFIGDASSAVQAKDTLHEHDVAILFADAVLSQTTMGILNARALVFVGEKIEENAKAFDKQLSSVGKYSVTKDKLPQETEFVFLG